MAKKAGKSKRTSKVSKSSTTSFSSKAISDKQTKSSILSSIADDTGLAKKEIATVFASLGQHIVRHMRRRGSGEFTIPETGVRVKRKMRPATKKRLGRNPATGEQITIAAKPARTVVKITALRSLKDSVNL